MNKIKPLLIISLILTSTLIFGQEMRQNIKGTVRDKDSKIPLIGVTLFIVDSNPLIGVTTDMDGNFKFQDLPLGRYTIQAQYLGYEPVTLKNILIGAGKEVILNVSMQESVLKIEEVVVNGKAHRAEALNKMSSVSARSFTVEETKRYAGSFNDPSRMATSFAGVSGDPDGDNDIIIRGNSPRGLLWRCEGIEIPNPNHFANEGATGGPISILNTTTLDNSDFFTGAFPAEYGNAFSGVFDLRLRKGNTEKREYSLQAGIIGTDMSFEGPFSKKGSASYLLNYRYSSLAMLNAIGIKIVGDAVPKFQDLTFNIYVPTERLGTFTMFGIGGLSTITESDEVYKNEFDAGMYTQGITHLFHINENTYIRSVISYAGTKNIWNYIEDDRENDFYYKGNEEFFYNTLRFSTTLNKKINASHFITGGVNYDQMYFNLYENSYDLEEKIMVSDLQDKGNTGLAKAHISYKYRPFNKLTLTGGVHSMYFLLNDNYTIEPRLGAKWKLNERQSISAGFGVHSKIETISNYYAKSINEVGDTIIPNRNIEPIKANHYVLGYDNLLAKNLYFKLELYYQKLYNIPVDNSDSSSFSALNHGSGYTSVPLANKGTGENYGIEFTLEKFYANKYFFLMTASLYESKYKALDGINRNSRYNGNYVFNALAGKEFKLGNHGRDNSITVTSRVIWAGGQRYTPIDIEESREYGYTRRDNSKAYSRQYEDYLRVDLKVSYRKNKKKSTRVWEIDIQNVTANENVTGDWYNYADDQIETWSQLGFLPTLNYRIEF